MTTYQVALSYAGEQRDYVERVARFLQAKGVALFYDRFEATNLWGKDGIEFFHQLFSADTAYVLMFISKEYVEKSWPQLERRSALSKAINEQKEYVLPVRFDSTEVPGLPSSVQFFSTSEHSPEELASKVIEKMGINPLVAKASDLPPPHSKSVSGVANFDYSSCDGRYLIGAGQYQFLTKWSKASNVSIHIVNDPANIHGVALAVGFNNISDIPDASIFDFTSRHRTPRVGEIIIWRNTNGFYAAAKILEIWDSSRNAEQDLLHFEYVIQSDGTGSFTNTSAG